MSTILITSPVSSLNVAKVSRTKSVISDRHDFNVIIWSTVIVFAFVLTIGLLGPFILSIYGGATGLGLDINSKCAERIHAFEQIGYYTSPEQYKVALSYCR